MSPFVRTTRRRPHLDSVVLLSLLIFTMLFATRAVDFSIPPHEDAAILMRYADHFAHGHGVVWNIGEKPVDGATDFLFMVVLGLFVKAGLSLESAARMIGFVSHVLTVWIVYLSARRLYGARVIPALVNSIYLAVGPGLYYVAAYFGTPFFALFACIAWWTALNVIYDKSDTKANAPIFALSALITALIRPEGVILSALMLLAVISIRGAGVARSAILWYLMLFLLVGGSYFVWRWQYFGYPLPNPYYIKSSIHTGSLLQSVRNVLGGSKASLLNVMKLCLPFLLPFVAGTYTPRTLRLSVGLSVPILGFALAFGLLSNEMNFGARFQYVLLPIVLMSWWPLLAGIREDLSFPKWPDLGLHKRVALTLSALLVCLGVIGYQYKVGRATTGRDGLYDMAVMLSDYRDKGYTMAVTEAGQLPLYSHWRAIDAWGLNDQWIAHAGGVSEQYLDRFKPQIVMFHAGFSPQVPPTGKGRGKWSDMTTALKSYVERDGYTLAAVFGDNPHDTHYYYVRADFPESAEIVSRIRTLDYFWYATGRKAVNYVLAPERY
jgi:arabinofuranosyltransferase